MMSENFDDTEFWLPPHFLNEDEQSFNGGNKGFVASGGSSPFCFGGSDLSSPVSSTDSDLNDEEYLVWLTRQMKNSSLNDSFTAPKASYYHENKGFCGCTRGLSHGSPTGPLLPASAPVTWDLLFSNAEEVAKMRVSGDGVLSGSDSKPSAISASLKNSDRDLCLKINQSSYLHQLQAIQIQQMEQVLKMKQLKQAMWEEQMKVQHHHNYDTNINVHNGILNLDFNGKKTGRQVSMSPTVWPPLQKSQLNQPNRSGMRAVFLNQSAAKKECPGTGVFLPRRAGYPPEYPKKPACSTALLPARVVQALKLNVIDISSQPQPPPPIHPRNNCNFNPDDPALKRRNMNFLIQQTKQDCKIRSQPVMNPEFRLPQEWTY